MEAIGIDELEPIAPNATTVQFDMEGDNVLHFCALPNGETTIENHKYPDDPYLKYNFEFDAFQKCAISCVHNNESVLVSAHTSAGKTVIAKYAIASALRNNQRVIYTSPIKALSNQKFKEFVDEFDPDTEDGSNGKLGLVGLQTGDVTINKSAPILVMTTEILRIMLFTGDSLINEVQWVIYDEVHYMKDPNRGVVWEESIIMLPDQVRFVFLSATIPNAREFSEWVAKIHRQPCHVVYTEHRPVPLRYYISPLGQAKPFLVRDADGEINDKTFSTACSAVKLQTEASKTVLTMQVKSAEGPKSKVSKKQISQHTCNIVKHLYNSDLYPMIVFVFSRRECEDMHQHLGTANFLQPEEREIVERTFQNAIQQIQDVEDRKLPQIDAIHRLVIRGIGIHHGGLLPILKEVVELLFQYHLIKVLFATETFSMGLNMPAKTCIFNSLYKWDGKERRLINTSEYIQMAGRAGRRNKDKFGAVVINYFGEPTPPELKGLMTSAAMPLNSEFRVTYNMLLNMMTTANGDPRRIMRRSFHQFQMERQLPELKERREQLLRDAEEITFNEDTMTEEETKRYVELDAEVRRTEREMRRIAFCEENARLVLVPGRIVVLEEWGPGIVVTVPNKGEFCVIANAYSTSSGNVIPYSRANVNKRVTPTLISVSLSELSVISPQVVQASFDSLSNKMVAKLYAAIATTQIPAIDGKDLAKTHSDRYAKLLHEHNKAIDARSAIRNVDENTIAKFLTKQSLIDTAEVLSQKISSLERLTNHKDLDAMNNLLESLGFIKKEQLGNKDVYLIEEKGRIAAMINAADEIVLTELLMDGWITDDDTPQRIAALLSIFVSEDYGADSDIEGYEDQITKLKATLERVADMSISSGIDLDKNLYISKFPTSSVKVVEEWANDVKFKTIVEEHKEIYEGSLVRTLRRLDELINQVEKAVTKIGNENIANKLRAASKLVDKGIVHTKSLYTNK